MELGLRQPLPSALIEALETAGAQVLALPDDVSVLQLYGASWPRFCQWVSGSTAIDCLVQPQFGLAAPLAQRAAVEAELERHGTRAAAGAHCWRVTDRAALLIAHKAVERLGADCALLMTFQGWVVARRQES